MLFTEYYEEWINTYKKGSVREVTFKKYRMTLRWLKELVPNLVIENLTRKNYQLLINKYAETHEKRTVMDFHFTMKSSIRDAIDEKLLKVDPTRKVIFRGKIPTKKKEKFLSKSELKALLKALKLDPDEISMEWFILLLAKTGLRFSEALGLTKADFDFDEDLLSINKTLDYKNGIGFAPTKNRSSNRVILIDGKLSKQFKKLTRELDDDEPIFVPLGIRVHNSTFNSLLRRYCEEAEIQPISIHGLRHTHASILLCNGISIMNIASRLGHADTTTTQNTYLHIIEELNRKDSEKMEEIIGGF